MRCSFILSSIVVDNCCDFFFFFVLALLPKAAPSTRAQQLQQFERSDGGRTGRRQGKHQTEKLGVPATTTGRGVKSLRGLRGAK